MIANIGGYLGLFLGYAILQIPNFFSGLINYLFVMQCGKKNSSSRMGTPAIFMVADSSSVGKHKSYSEGHSEHHNNIFHTLQQRMIDFESQIITLKHEIDLIKASSE